MSLFAGRARWSSWQAAQESMPVYDRIVIGGVGFLLCFSPLAFGAVHPWAFIALEAIVFLLVAVWMVKLLVCRLPLFSLSSRVSVSLWLPLFLFLGFGVFQQALLPPSVLRILSPATYELYARSLPGWPEQTPYEAVVERAASGTVVNDGELAVSDNAEGASPAVPFFAFNLKNLDLRAWRPLSLAPELSKKITLLLCAYAGVFFLVLSYPCGDSAAQRQEAERRFLLTIFATVLAIGVLVALLGIVQRFTWNGKILWFFIPQDWDGPQFGENPRASGPFVNSDHFANYLTLIFPLALAWLSWELHLPVRLRRPAVRLFSSVGLLLFFMGILLSLSRGGWIGMIIGGGVFLAIFPAQRLPWLFGRGKRKWWLVLVVLLAFLLLAFFLIGPAGRSQVDLRLGETVTRETSLWVRVTAWRDSWGMVKDFPWWGVGLGAWSELFPRYQQPPWSISSFGEAHNDYVQLLVEGGLVGAGLLAWFFIQVGRKLKAKLPLAMEESAPFYAALVAALAAMAFHEGVDFNLQIPANALLFTVLLASALRLAVSGKEARASADLQASEREPAAPESLQIPKVAVLSRRSLSAAIVLVAAFTLSVVALRQERDLFADNPEKPVSILEARDTLLAYPAQATVHEALYDLLEGRVSPAGRLRELEIALWLDPNNPYVRGRYVQALRKEGRREAALQELRTAVRLAPQLSDHPFLQQGLSALTDEERTAVEEGLTLALQSGSPGSPQELAAFYLAIDRFVQAGELCEKAAQGEEDPDEKTLLLLDAGLAYAKAGEPARAERLLRDLIRTRPRELRAYRLLVTEVLPARGEFTAVKNLLAEGMRNGVDPVPLLLVTAAAAEKMGQREEAKSALLQAFALQRSSLEVNLRLGRFYLQERAFDHAAQYFRRAVRIDPRSALTLTLLADAEVGRYRFAAAQEAYRRAVRLDPKNEEVQRRYATFLRKVAEQAPGEIRQ